MDRQHSIDIVTDYYHNTFLRTTIPKMHHFSSCLPTTPKMHCSPTIQPPCLFIALLGEVDMRAGGERKIQPPTGRSSWPHYISKLGNRVIKKKKNCPDFFPEKPGSIIIDSLELLVFICLFSFTQLCFVLKLMSTPPGSWYYKMPVSYECFTLQWVSVFCWFYGCVSEKLQEGLHDFRLEIGPDFCDSLSCFRFRTRKTPSVASKSIT